MVFAHIDLVYLISSYGYIAIAVLLAGGIFGLPIPDETIMIISGYMVYSGVLDYCPTILASWIGSILGMTLSFMLGYYLGLPALNRYGYRLGLNEERLSIVQKWYNRFGKFTIPIGYFVPGIRQLNAFFSAVSKMAYREFICFACPGGLIWVLVFVNMGFFLGKGWEQLTRRIDPYHYIVLGIVTIAVMLYAFITIKRKYFSSHNTSPGDKNHKA
jgi:membrane protein DedA with SNARE-associated domain